MGLTQKYRYFLGQERGLPAVRASWRQVALRDEIVADREVEFFPATEVKAVGSISLAKGVEHGITAVTGNPVVGKAAGAATAIVPDRVKAGAAVGSMLGASAAGHAMVGGQIALGISAFCPAILVGAVLVGGIAWFLRDE